MGSFLDIITGKKNLTESIKTEEIGILTYSDLMNGYIFVDKDRAYVIQTQILEYNAPNKSQIDLKVAAVEYHVFRISEVKVKPPVKKKAPVKKKVKKP